MLVVIAAGLVQWGLRKLASSGTSERPVLRLGVQDNAICALPFIAAEKGFFRDAGIAVDLKRYPSGKLALQGMFNGEVDIAACADMPIMIQSFQRDDLAIFATIAWTERGAWIIARRDSGIDGPADLRGKRIATQRNSAVHFFLSMFLLKHGIGEDEIKVIFMPAVELPGALAAGRIDAFSMRDPFIAAAKARIGHDAIEMFAPNVYRQTFNLVTWRRTLDTNAAGLERLLKGLATAEAFLIAHETAAVAAVTSQLGNHREREIRLGWPRFTLALTLDQGMFVTLEDQARWALKHQPELGDAIPNYFTFVDTRPMMTVKPEAVSIIR